MRSRTRRPRSAQSCSSRKAATAVDMSDAGPRSEAHAERPRWTINGTGECDLAGVDRSPRCGGPPRQSGGESSRAEVHGWRGPGRGARCPSGGIFRVLFFGGGLVGGGRWRSNHARRWNLMNRARTGHRGRHRAADQLARCSSARRRPCTSSVDGRLDPRAAKPRTYAEVQTRGRTHGGLRRSLLERLPLTMVGINLDPSGPATRSRRAPARGRQSRCAEAAIGWLSFFADTTGRSTGMGVQPVHDPHARWSWCDRFSSRAQQPSTPSSRFGQKADGRGREGGRYTRALEPARPNARVAMELDVRVRDISSTRLDRCDRRRRIDQPRPGGGGRASPDAGETVTGGERSARCRAARAQTRRSPVSSAPGGRGPRWSAARHRFAGHAPA